MNAMEWNRDLRWDLPDIRKNEAHLSDKKDRGNGVVSFPAMRRGRVGLCVGTQIARYVKPNNQRSGWSSPEQAWAHTQSQLAWYRAMERDGQLVQIRDAAQLTQHLDRWLAVDADPDAPAEPDLPIGYIMSLEGADSMVTLDYLEQAYADGLRALGPAHYGPGTYATGTEAEGGLSDKGRDLLREMDRLGMILDTTHLTDEGFDEGLTIFQGPVWASHCNCRTLVNHQRQVSDSQIQRLLERNAVIGMVFDAWMMVPGWERGRTTPEQAQLRVAAIVEHIDHICQLAGNADHVGLGSDLDGGYGTEQCPTDLDSIEKLGSIADLLRQRGYTEPDVEKVMFRNWVNFLTQAWSK